MIRLIESLNGDYIHISNLSSEDCDIIRRLANVNYTDEYIKNLLFDNFDKDVISIDDAIGFFRSEKERIENEEREQADEYDRQRLSDEKKLRDYYNSHNEDGWTEDEIETYFDWYKSVHSIKPYWQLSTIRSNMK